jgi:hypothetical protein
MAVTNGGARPPYMDGGGGAVRRCAAPATPRQGFYGDDSSRFASGAIFRASPVRIIRGHYGWTIGDSDVSAGGGQLEFREDDAIT